MGRALGRKFPVLRKNESRQILRGRFVRRSWAPTNQQTKSDTYGMVMCQNDAELPRLVPVGAITSRRFKGHASKILSSLRWPWLHLPWQCCLCNPHEYVFAPIVRWVLSSMVTLCSFRLPITPGQGVSVLTGL